MDKCTNVGILCSNVFLESKDQDQGMRAVKNLGTETTLGDVFVCLFYKCLAFCYFLIEFIMVTVVHEAIEISSVQLKETAFAHCIVCLQPKGKSLSIPIYLPFATSTSSHLPFPLAITTLFSVSM